jgi:hypothetical protein
MTSLAPEQLTEFAKVVEVGPDREVDGVVRCNGPDAEHGPDSPPISSRRMAHHRQARRANKHSPNLSALARPN